MPARLLLLLALALPWLAACQAPNATAPRNRVTIIEGEFPSLSAGMSAAEVRQRLGDPAQIQSLPAADATAEMWLYYLEKSLGRITLVTGMTGTLSSGTLAGDYGRSGIGPDYILAERKVLVTLRLLMVDGRLSAHTARSEERMEF